MPKKAASSTDLMTTIARGVGSAVGRIANTAQRLATASSEVVKRSSTQGKKAKKTKPSTRKKAVKKTTPQKPKAKTKAKKKTSRVKA